MPTLSPGEQVYCWIGGYVPNGDTFDSLMLGLWERRGLRFVGFLKKNWQAGEKEALFAGMRELPLATCPFYNLPVPEGTVESGAGATGELAQCRWLFPSQRLSVAHEELAGIALEPGAPTQLEARVA
ncbi:MAG: hypothetical protein ACAI34_11120 [Verrucomicrobium sp.]